MLQHTNVDWFRFCKEVCAFKMCAEIGPDVGGPGLHVQIDVTFLHEHKYGKGRETGLRPRQLKLFGGICIEVNSI